MRNILYADKRTVNILSQGAHIPSSLSVFSFPALLVWANLALGLPLPALSICCCSVGIDYLRPEVSAVCVCVCVCVCGCTVRACICFTVSSSTACWEGRYLWRFCNRADTVARLTLPWGTRGRERWKVVGGWRGISRGEGRGWEYPPFTR